MFDWNRIRLIASREIKARVSTRSYIASLIIQVVIVALLALSPIIVARFTGGDDAGPTTEHVAVVDLADANASAGLKLTLQALTADTNTVFELVDAATEADARDLVEAEDADYAIVVQKQDDKLGFVILSESGDVQDSTTQMLMAAANALAIQYQIDQSGMSAEEVQQVFAAPALNIVNADPSAETSEDDGIGDIVNYVIAYAATILIFIFIVLYGQWIAQGVVEEKASRIMEIMVNAATPRDLLAGKVIGIMATALMQVIPIALTAGIIASFQTQIGKLFGVSEDQLFNLDFGVIAWSSMGWFVLYFLLGFLLFGALYAGVGSLVSRQEEVATAVAPMTTVMMVGYFAALLSMSDPDGIIARIAYLFPGTSVFVAMLRLVNGNPQPWEIAVSIIGLLIAIVLALMLAARLYRVGVLMYGQAPKFSQIFKLGGMQEVTR